MNSWHKILQMPIYLQSISTNHEQCEKLKIVRQEQESEAWNESYIWAYESKLDFFVTISYEIECRNVSFPEIKYG